MELSFHMGRSFVKFWLVRAFILSALVCPSSTAFAATTWTCQEFTPCGSASCYLIGTYDLRFSRQSWVQVINARGSSLKVIAMFFDSEEKPLACKVATMSPNDL